MHEVGIIQNTLDVAIKAAQNSGAKQIHVLRMRVGAMTGVVADALQFAFEVVRQGTLAEQATLEIENVPVTCWCASCQTEFACDNLSYQCPRCGQLSSELRHGRELELASLEIS